MKAVQEDFHRTCEPAFEAVVHAFNDNFNEGVENGASCCVYVDGKPVVDMWGGCIDEARTSSWQPDTVVNLMSIAKGIASLCIHRMSEQGRIDLDARGAKHWPEFAQNGKGDGGLSIAGP